MVAEKENLVKQLRPSTKTMGSLANDVRTCYSMLQPQEIVFFRTAFAIIR